jgi:predicted RNase H-like nuclease (RuvC/YqgF family)
MLPLVEAGATVEQAARRFGEDDESAADIAAGFSRWIARGGGRGDEPTVAAPDPRLAQLERALNDAQGRITALEAENRGLRRDLTSARQAITRVRSILDSAAG